MFLSVLFEFVNKVLTVNVHGNEIEKGYIISATFLKTLDDWHAVFGSEVNLKCAISDPIGICKWYKNGKLVKSGEAEAGGNERSLHFPSISHDDEGEYECRCGNESTKARIEVKGKR